MIEINLTWAEMMTGATVGLRRQIMNLRDGCKHRHGFKGDPWAAHIEGACAEMAVGKALDKYWSGNVGDLSAADVGLVEVRTSASHTNRLILHPSDSETARWILVTGTAPSFRVQGWVYGYEAKRGEFWEDPVGGRPAFFVPQARLRSMEEWGESKSYPLRIVE